MPGYEGAQIAATFSPDYSFVLVAAMPVSESWPDGNSGEANSRNF
jgi:hypothetical protein